MTHDLNLGDGAVQRFLGETPSARPDVNPMRLPAPSSAVTVLQGDDDEIVPTVVAKSYCEAFPQTRLVQVPECGHFALIDPASAAWASVIAELEGLA